MLITSCVGLGFNLIMGKILHSGLGGHGAHGHHGCSHGHSHGNSKAHKHN